MVPTVTEVYIAVVMVAIAAAIFVLFQRGEAAAAARRMSRMMVKAGLDTGAAVFGDRETGALLNGAGKSCRKCRSEGLCERWLAGDASGDNGFCPNAWLFRNLFVSQ